MDKAYHELSFTDRAYIGLFGLFGIFGPMIIRYGYGYGLSTMVYSLPIDKIELNVLERKCEYVDIDLPELIKIVDNMGERIERIEQKIEKIPDKKTVTLSPMNKEDRGIIEYVDFEMNSPPVRVG